MSKLSFTKMVASGNDFVVIESSHKGVKSPPQKLAGPPRILAEQGHKLLVKKICDRKYGVGADGVLLLEKSKIADTKMRIFNADGSEAEMCGNGARCTALYISRQSTVDGQPRKTKIETKAGIIGAEVFGDNVKIKLTDPKDIKLDIPIKINNKDMKVNFIDTGVPHAVIFTEGLEQIDIVPFGRLIRHHGKFSPRGTNVNFIEVLGDDSIKVRTYERGVEDETLACGTGSAASAIIFALKINASGKIYVQTRSREVLTLHFEKLADKFSNVWLEGKAKKVYEGEYYV